MKQGLIDVADVSPTRGHGLLESFLARQRRKVANKLIPDSHRSGRILDVGCGSYPLFLLDTAFAEKFGIDKSVTPDRLKHRKGSETHPMLMNWDVEGSDTLPFEGDGFTVVTMLAVFEHIEPERLVSILTEVYRVLRSDGVFIMTTPAAWTDRLLRVMAQFGLVSRTEIEEHKDAYSCSKIACILQEANFEKSKLRFGYFEAFMNIWATATK
jgi:SAM-dependent methyltransferase